MAKYPLLFTTKIITSNLFCEILCNLDNSSKTSIAYNAYHFFEDISSTPMVSANPVPMDDIADEQIILSLLFTIEL